MDRATCVATCTVAICVATVLCSIIWSIYCTYHDYITNGYSQVRMDGCTVWVKCDPKCDPKAESVSKEVGICR